MLYLLGTDEAGYGPNLGPLVIAASLWRIDDAALDAPPDLYERLKNCFTNKVSRRDDGRIAVADSKSLYSSGDSWELLETGVHLGLRLLKRDCPSWRSIWSQVQSGEVGWQAWHGEFDCPLPRDVTNERLEACVDKSRESMATAGVELVAMRAAVVQPSRFNDGCDREGSKGVVLSRTTLGLIGELLPVCRDGEVRVMCDKHGGRSSYGGLLWDCLSEEIGTSDDGFPLQVLSETREESVYRWKTAGRTREIRFTAKGERFLPTAFASMTAKYLRELDMAAWNHFWGRRFPDLQPTAGYPLDAKRYRDAIEPTTIELGWSLRDWWRSR